MSRPVLPLGIVYSTWDEQGEHHGVLYERLSLNALVGVQRGQRLVEKYETPWIESRPLETVCRPKVEVRHNGTNAYYVAGCWMHLSGTRAGDHHVALTLARLHVEHAETETDPFLWPLERVDMVESRVTGKPRLR